MRQAKVRDSVFQLINRKANFVAHSLAHGALVSYDVLGSSGSLDSPCISLLIQDEKLQV